MPDWLRIVSAAVPGPEMFTISFASRAEAPAHAVSGAAAYKCAAPKSSSRSPKNSRLQVILCRELYSVVLIVTP
jgi:hypothetical protein